MAMALGAVCRTSVAGDRLDLLVLAATRAGCIGVDVTSGALVRAAYGGIADVALAPFDVARGVVAATDADDIDPVQPEAVTLRHVPEGTGHLDRRAAERLLRPLLHPREEHLFGTPGGAIPYWELRGDHPSVALVEPPLPPAVIGDTCRFLWRGLHQTLPVDPAAPRPRARPRRLLVALTPPHEGHCYKVVAALLPG